MVNPDIVKKGSFHKIKCDLKGDIKSYQAHLAKYFLARLIALSPVYILLGTAKLLMLRKVLSQKPKGQGF